MQFGLCLPHRWKYASARLIADVAQEAESLRFDSVWVTDHVIVPVHHVERGHIFYEALMTLAFVSSITRSVALGTTVLAMPTRNPVVLAREVATLDALSGGRVILGLGTGWIREELEAVGVVWAERGRFLDEGIKVLRLLCSEEGPISFSGRYTTFREMLFEARPAADLGRWDDSTFTEASRPDGRRMVAVGRLEGRVGRRSGEDPQTEWRQKDHSRLLQSGGHRIAVDRELHRNAGRTPPRDHGWPRPGGWHDRGLSKERA